MDFQVIADALFDIQSTGSNKAKQSLLCDYGASVCGFKQVLKFIYDPYIKTGLKSAKLDAADISDQCLSVEEIMGYLKDNNTGTRADAELANGFIYSSDDPNWQWAATGLVTKDLQIGVSVTTLNNVYGNAFIPRIGIMRGMLCPVDWHGTAIVTEKIDGNRRLFFNTFKEGVKVYTRSGKPDKGLTEIEKEIAAYLPKGFLYDCECVAIGDYADSIELRQASASILNRRNQERTGVKALCFDMVPIDDYWQKRSKVSALGRKTMLAGATNQLDSLDKLRELAKELDEKKGNVDKLVFDSAVLGMFKMYYDPNRPALQHFFSLPILGYVHTHNEGVEIAKRIWDVHGEGVMLVEYNSPYEVNPNPRSTLLKIKLLKEYTVECLDVYEGDNKYKGSLGGITVDWNGAIFNVGTGFSDLDRDYFWQHPEAIIGKCIEIESFGESVNKQGGRALNCPVFKRVVGEVD